MHKQWQNASVSHIYISYYCFRTLENVEKNLFDNNVPCKKSKYFQTTWEILEQKLSDKNGPYSSFMIVYLVDISGHRYNR